MGDMDEVLGWFIGAGAIAEDSPPAPDQPLSVKLDGTDFFVGPSMILPGAVDVGGPSSWTSMAIEGPSNQFGK